MAKRYKALVLLTLLIKISAAASTGESIAPLFQQQNYATAEKLVLAKIRAWEAQQANEESKKIDRSTDLAAHYFALGKLRYQQKQYSAAEADLLQSLDLQSPFPDYNYYYLGLAARAQGDDNKAKRFFSKVLTYRPRSHLQLQAQWEMAQIAMDKKQHKSAYTLLRHLEKKMRSDEEHPQILYSLALVSSLRNQIAGSCRWLRKLYRSYPNHSLTKDWGADLAQVKFGVFAPRCKETAADRSSRIKRLLWAGEGQRALREIEDFRKNSGDAYGADTLLVRYYNHTGEVFTSLKILEKYFESKKYDFDYLNKLAATSAKIGKYPQAVGLYYKAYKMRPRGRQARDALFSGAYLSYQFQDYDGAARKFEELIEKFPTSGLARDARWHLAWIRYLKSDYTGAYEQMTAILKKPRLFRSSRAISEDKVVYWRAMSLWRMEKKEQAITEFRRLALKPEYSFYALAARSRLLGSIDSTVARQPANLDFKAFDTSFSSAIEQNQADKGEASESEEQIKILGENEDLDREEEEISQKEEQQEQLSQKRPKTGASLSMQVEEDATDPTLLEEEPIQVSHFPSELMNQRFARAQQLIQFGMYDLARWELYDIEKRTRNLSYLKTLMEAYHRIGAYHRSSYIGQVYFSGERAKAGLKGAKNLWDYTYPRAYEQGVVAAAREFNVPKEFVWGIMRQESQFRKEVRSPVGARGLMQIMPYTADKLAQLLGDRSFAVDQLNDPQINIRFGTRYLQRLNKKFNNKYPLTAAAYNAGPHRVDAWLKTFGHLDMDEFIEHIPFLETRLYVKKVMSNFHVYELLGEATGLEMDVAMLSQPVGLTYVGKLPTKENWN